MNVIGDPRPFLSDLYRELNVVNRFDYGKYEINYISQMKIIHSVFPFIKRLYIPYKNPHFIALRGILVPLNYMEIMGVLNEHEAESIGLDVFIVFTSDDFLYKIYDARDVIRWMNIPEQYVHRRENRTEYSLICTHLNTDSKKDSLLSVLYSAWHLFVEYKKLERTGAFELECVTH